MGGLNEITLRNLIFECLRHGKRKYSGRRTGLGR